MATMMPMMHPFEIPFFAGGGGASKLPAGCVGTFCMVVSCSFDCGWN
jgi:hypothetical protein